MNARMLHPSRPAPTRGQMAAAASWLLDDVCARRQLDPDTVKLLLAEWLAGGPTGLPDGLMVEMAEMAMDSQGARAIEGLQVIGGQS